MNAMENRPEGVAEDLIHEVEDAIHATGGDLTEEQVEEFLRKLDTALAINNDDGARQLRNYLIRRFRE